MKQVQILFAVIATGLALFLASCETEPVPVAGPTISKVLSNGADTLTVFEDSSFVVNITASAGDADLTTINVKQDGQNVDIARLVFDGDPAGSNPSPLAATFASGFSWEVTITADLSASSVYEVIVTDVEGQADTTSFEIFTVAVPDPATPVDVRTAILLLNQGGPVNTGGLDIETGTSTGTSMDADSSDLHDNGIDTNLPLDENWNQTFKPANGADLRQVPAGADYDLILTKEEVAAAYEEGTSISETPAKVQTGDVFVVRTGAGNTYLMKVTNVVVTTADNADYYEFEVKN